MGSLSGMCDTHAWHDSLCAWHDSLCAWHESLRAWLDSHMRDMIHICVTWLMCMTHMRVVQCVVLQCVTVCCSVMQNTFLTWLTAYDTHAWNESFPCVTHIHDMTLSWGWYIYDTCGTHDSFVCRSRRDSRSSWVVSHESWVMMHELWVMSHARWHSQLVSHEQSRTARVIAHDSWLIPMCDTYMTWLFPVDDTFMTHVSHMTCS